MNNNQAKVRKVFSAILLCVMAVCVFVIGKNIYETNGSESELKKVYSIAHKDIEISDNWFSKETFKELHDLNNDFVAYIEFDSGIISLPVLQTTDNEYYLHHTFYKNYYYLHGHPFMNAQSKIDDQNIIIYGHNNRTGDSQMFSPLNSLFDQRKYEENSTFKIYFEDSVRSYVITHIYQLTKEEYQDYDFEKPFIFEDEWDEWIKYADSKNSIIPVNGTIEYVNHFVTLQTCSASNDKIVIVLAREVSKEPY